MSLYNQPDLQKAGMSKTRLLRSLALVLRGQSRGLLSVSEALERKASNRHVCCIHTTTAVKMSWTSRLQATSSGEPSETSQDLTSYYERSVEQGRLRPDSHQAAIIAKLQRLNTVLQTYHPPALPAPQKITTSWISRFLGSSDEPPPSTSLELVPKGVYLYGDVGTGKTMLMDLFYDTVPEHLKPYAKRIHFHAFMLDVLQKQHEIQTKFAALGKEHRVDATPEVARQLAAEARVLCFDEFQVTDIVTAMILRQLLERLMTYGVVCVMTSNRHPDALYVNGIQRSSFLPAIQMIKDRFQIIDLNSGTDYRKVPKALSKVYFDPLNEATQSEMRKLFESLASSEEQVPTRRILKLWGREVTIPEATDHVARFIFDDLCGKPLSAADYLEITKTFRTVFVENVPRMGLDEKDMARRFITFIDACYESRTKVFISSQIPINRIFSAEHGDSRLRSDEMQGFVRALCACIADYQGADGDDVGYSPLFSGEEEVFAFARCVSRLVQMGTKEWAETA